MTHILIGGNACARDGAGSLCPSLVWAQSDTDTVGIALLDHGSGARSRPRAVEQLMWEVSKRTSIRVRESVRYVKLDSEELFENPLLVWIGHADCEPFSAQSRRRLSQFLRAGGSLLISDASPPGDDAFDACVRREMQAIWSDRDGCDSEATIRLSVRSICSKNQRGVYAAVVTLKA